MTDQDKDIIIQQQRDIIALMQNPVMVVNPSLRDQFAMAALPALMADPDNIAFPIGYAEMAYQYADAMLAEREKKK
jgi:hypothetical protein